MEATKFQSVCSLEKRLDAVLNELLALNEDLFNSHSYDLKNLPVDYCASDTAINNGSSILYHVISGLKIQAILADNSLLENEDLSNAKEEILELALTHNG